MPRRCWFYGTPDLIALCRKGGWGYRLRLKGWLLVFDAAGGETTLADMTARGERVICGAALTHKRVLTNIAILHEYGHTGPWMITMDENPNEYKALDYGLRWGIEAMFSDFKTRGFDLEESQLRYPDRVARLILVMAITLYWAVSTGIPEFQHEVQHPLTRCDNGWLSRPRGMLPWESTVI